MSAVTLIVAGMVLPIFSSGGLGCASGEFTVTVMDCVVPSPPLLEGVISTTASPAPIRVSVSIVCSSFTAAVTTVPSP